MDSTSAGSKPLKAPACLEAAGREEGETWARARRPGGLRTVESAQPSRRASVHQSGKRATAGPEPPAWRAPASSCMKRPRKSAENGASQPEGSDTSGERSGRSMITVCSPAGQTGQAAAGSAGMRAQAGGESRPRAGQSRRGLPGSAFKAAAAASKHGRRRARTCDVGGRLAKVNGLKAGAPPEAVQLLRQACDGGADEGAWSSSSVSGWQQAAGASRGSAGCCTVAGRPCKQTKEAWHGQKRAPASELELSPKETPK